MSDFITKLSELIDPEVMGDMVSARIPKKLRVAPFAKIDDTLQGVPGDTITVPAYTYIGDASDVAEGGEVAIEKMTTSTRKATIKKAMKGIGLTDEAVLSGYGNPVGEANTQLAQAIAAKVDNDCMDALQTASLIYDGSQAQISYNAIVDAVDLFEEEMGCSDKVLFIHPKQVTQLRKNPDFLSADKYTPGVSLTGEIGMIAGCRLVPSKKVPLTEGVYACPIVKLEADPEVDDEIPALTIYRKREVNIETERKPKTRTTEITADEFYVAVLSNEAKVVLAKVKAEGGVRVPDYTFYVEDYLGEDIPEKEFPRFIRRAGNELRRMREMYAVAPRQGLDPELAESMALCAVADAMYEFAQEDEARGIAKVSVGSVSETYTAPPELCSRTLADRAAHFRHEAGYYLRIGRWLPHE